LLDIGGGAGKLQLTRLVPLAGGFAMFLATRVINTARGMTLMF
jgi:hypothetical protein